jgi:hypothetical protein
VQHGEVAHRTQAQVNRPRPDVAEAADLFSEVYRHRHDIDSIWSAICALTPEQAQDALLSACGGLALVLDTLAESE